MSSLNRVILIGRATAQPELRYTTAGKAATTIRLAVDRRGKDAGADFFDCVCWERTAEIAAEYVQKGKQLCVEGRLQAREWQDKEGNKRRTVEVVVDSLQLLGSRDDGQQATAPQPHAHTQPQQRPAYSTRHSVSGRQAAAATFSGGDGLDMEDVPF